MVSTIFRLIRILVTVVLLTAGALLFGIFLAIGGLVLLLASPFLGRRVSFKVYTNRGFRESFSRPPMKDVTPPPAESLPGNA